jgi:hypothetical protein
MPNREEALRRILEATGVSARLSDEQKRELLTHVDDAVEAKVGAGVPEMEAVGQAFAELGDLEKIAGQYPKALPFVVAPDGSLHLWWGGAAEMGYFLLLFVAFVEMMILPMFSVVYAKTHAPLPGLTVRCLTLAGLMRDYWPLVIVGLLLLGAGVYRIRRLDRWRRVVELVLVLGGAVACAAVLAATTLPLISLLEGTWRR